MNKKLINEFLSNTVCQACGAPLVEADLVIVLDTPVASVFHARCGACSQTSLLVATLSGVGVASEVSDLSSDEIGRFLGQGPLVDNDVLDIHQLLKKESLWNLLQKSVTSSEKKLRTTGLKAGCPPLSSAKK